MRWKPDPMRSMIESWLRNTGFRTTDMNYGFGMEDSTQEKVDESSAVSALKLLSFYGEIEPTTLDRRSIERSTGREIDCSDRLSRQTALFVGFSRDPSPARLCGRVSGGNDNEWEPYKVSRSLVMYRVWIPVR